MIEKNNILAITEELHTYANEINESQLSNAVEMILDAKRIFVAGAGRSGFVARAFSNRLMHLGLQMYFVGEPTTPSIRKNDLLFIISGSGNTMGLVNNANIAKREGAKIVTITIFPENKIGMLADLCITLPGVTDKVTVTNQSVSIQPAGNMFEQLSWITCDALGMSLKEKLKQTQDDMHYRHANME